MKPGKTSRWKLLQKCKALLLIFINLKAYFIFRQFLVHTFPKQNNIKFVGSVNSWLLTADCDAYCTSKKTDGKYRKMFRKLQCEGSRAVCREHS